MTGPPPGLTTKGPAASRAPITTGATVRAWRAPNRRMTASMTIADGNDSRAIPMYASGR
jgi:hypothetical protein